jgi:hypothetical protein
MTRRLPDRRARAAACSSSRYMGASLTMTGRHYMALRYFDFGAGVMPLFLQELANGAQIAGHPPEAA